jgi:hypothetical protein
MSPLCQRILCDLLFGIECFRRPLHHAQQDAKTDKHAEWPRRLHAFILSGVTNPNTCQPFGTCGSQINRPTNPISRHLSHTARYAEPVPSESHPCARTT